MTQQVDIAVSDRAVKAEPQALADWANKEVVPVLKKLRDAINGLDSDGAVPGGPAGHQIGGTYPDAVDVRGLRETSGPTELTLGAWADGQVLTRSGSTAIGTSAGATPVTLRGFRSEDQGGAHVSAQTRYHPVGIHHASHTGAYFESANLSGLQGIGAGQMAYVYPEVFEHAVTVVRLALRTDGTSATTAGARFKLGIYADSVLTSGVLTGSRYPGALLASSGDLDPAAAADVVLNSTISLSVAAGTRVWFLWVCNAQARTNNYSVAAYRASVLFPHIGFTMDAVTPTTIAQDEATQGVGYRHAITYGTTDALPDPFPQSAPAVLTGAVTQQLPVPFFAQTIT